jgi:hypothetical protein
MFSSKPFTACLVVKFCGLPLVFFAALAKKAHAKSAIKEMYLIEKRLMYSIISEVMVFTSV